MTKETKVYRGKLNTKIKSNKPRKPSIITGALDKNIKERYLQECTKYSSEVSEEKFLKLLEPERYPFSKQTLLF